MVETSGEDRYGRTLGRILLDKEDVNLWMVRNGWAWQFLRYSKSKALKEAQRAAEAEKKGLWVEEFPTAPWDWRAEESEKRLREKEKEVRRL